MIGLLKKYNPITYLVELQKELASLTSEIKDIREKVHSISFPTDNDDEKKEMLFTILSNLNKVTHILGRNNEVNWWDQPSIALEIDYIQRKLNILMNKVSKPSLPVKVAFIVSFPNNWPSIEPIYLAMLERDLEFNPIVICVDYHLTGEVQSSDIIKKLLDERGISYLDWGNLENHKYLLQYLDPDIIFRQTPYETSVPDPIRTLISGAYKICYLPYGLETVNTPSSTVNTEFFFAAWRIYSSTELQATYFRNVSKISKDNIRVVGNPRYDRIVQAIKDNKNTRDGVLPYKILWAPHHSVTDDWLSFGTFHENCWKILDFAKKNRDLEIIMRPHHILFDVLVSSKRMTAVEIDDFKNEWNKLENTKFDFSSDFSEVFLDSDVLLSDGVSFLAEYQITEKPVVFIERKNHVDFNIFGEYAVQGTYRCSTIEEALSKIIELRQKTKDILYNNRLNTKSLLTPCSKGAVNAILDDILSEFK